MRISLRDYLIVHKCTNPSCNNGMTGSCFNNTHPATVDVMSIIGEPKTCERCNIGVLSVKKASFATEKPKKSASNEFKYVVKCTECNVVWTTTRLTPLEVDQVRTIKFLKESSIDGLRCSKCDSNANIVLLHTRKL